MSMDRRQFLEMIAAAGAAYAVLPSPADASVRGAWDTLYPQILRSIKAPKFPKRDFAIAKFGAKAGLQNDSTSAIAAAIEACSKAGGGRVVVPAGEFSTGAIQLKSHVNLFLAKGATLKFSADHKKYPVVETRWEGMELMGFSAFIYANGQTSTLKRFGNRFRLGSRHTRIILIMK